MLLCAVKVVIYVGGCIFLQSNLLQLRIKWEPSKSNTIYSVKINYRDPKVSICSISFNLAAANKEIHIFVSVVNQFWANFFDFCFIDAQFSVYVVDIRFLFFFALNYVGFTLGFTCESFNLSCLSVSIFCPSAISSIVSVAKWFSASWLSCVMK